MNYDQIVKALSKGLTVHFKSERYIVSINDNGTLILTDAYNSEYVTWLMESEYKDCITKESNNAQD